MFKFFLITCKTMAQVVVSKPKFDGFALIFTAIITFFFKSMEADIWLFAGMYLLVFIDTLFGVIQAKRKKVYDRKVLKDRFMAKTFGYISFLVVLFLFLIMIFVATLKNGKAPISEYYYNIPMVTTFLFFSGMEFLSIKDKISDVFGIRTPASITKRVEGFIETEDLTKLTDTK